jgi:hypothetical protein
MFTWPGRQADTVVFSACYRFSHYICLDNESGHLIEGVPCFMHYLGAFPRSNTSSIAVSSDGYVIEKAMEWTAKLMPAVKVSIRVLCCSVIRLWG